MQKTFESLPKVSTLIICVILFQLQTVAQKIMAINEELNTESTQFEIKTKGLNPKYSFGEFEMISRKLAIDSRSTKAHFVPLDPEVETEAKGQFSSYS